MSDDITVLWRTGSPTAADGYHRRAEKAKVPASAPRKRADADGKEGKSVPTFREKSLKYRMQRGGGDGGFESGAGLSAGCRLRYGSTETWGRTGRGNNS